MKKLLLFVVFALFFINVFSQNDTLNYYDLNNNPKGNFNTYISEDSSIFHVGDTINGKIISKIIIGGTRGDYKAQYLTNDHNLYFFDDINNSITFSTQNGEIYYSEIIVNNKSKEDLYFLAKEWFVVAFKFPKYVIQIDDKDRGIIFVKGAFEVFTCFNNYKELGQVNFTISIEAENNKYRYTITNVWHECDNVPTPGNLLKDSPGGHWSNTMGEKNWNCIKKQTQQNIQDLKLSIISHMDKEIKW